MKTMVILISLTLALFSAAWTPAGAADPGKEAEKVLGVKGQLVQGSWVARFPRSDLRMTINHEALPTALGFGGWVAFTNMGRRLMLMGDLTLLENEVNPVIAALEAAGLQVTALHNHFLWEEPRIMFMHIQGMGEEGKLAQGLHNALRQTAIPLGSPASAQPALKPAPEGPPLDNKKIEQIVGEPGQVGGGVFKITLGRRGVKMAGRELTTAQGMSSWAAFVGTDDKAHVAGDIAMTATEVNRVIKALKEGGIDIVAVHNHMLDEKPRIFFLHFWGSGPADKLAQTIKAAFNQVRGPAK